MLLLRHQEKKRLRTVEFHSVAIQRVIHMLRERLDNEISLQEMAAHAYMSRCHFSRTFRQITGLPPRLFVSKLRVEAAARMLLDSETSVTEICLNVGYSSLGTFISTFSDALGISPTKLRSLRYSPLSRLIRHVISSACDSCTGFQPAISGRVHAPADFSGPIFLGLFTLPIPQGKPVICTVNLRPGEFSLRQVPPGSYYLFALGMEWPQSSQDFFRHEATLRGGGQFIVMEDRSLQCEDISLRPAVSTDPPVLVNLPFLLDHRQELKTA